MHIRWNSAPLILVLSVAAACDDGKSAGAPAASGEPTKPAATAAASAASAQTADEGADDATPAALRDKATKVMEALKKGDAAAAAAFCLGKHKEGFQKFIAESIENKEQSRNKAYQAWDGKLGEVRIDGKQARVKFGQDGDRIHFLSFRQKDGKWSLDDIPNKPDKQWSSWGKVVSE